MENNPTHDPNTKHESEVSTQDEADAPPSQPNTTTEEHVTQCITSTSDDSKNKQESLKLSNLDDENETKVNETKEKPVDDLPDRSSNAIENTQEEDKGKDANFYHIKWIDWKNERTPIVTQNENGPCPLLAIFNVLLLSRKITLDSKAEMISTQQILAHVANIIWEIMPKELPENERSNYEQNVSDAMSVFPNLQTGLDVNVRFSCVTSFEYTRELTVFDLLRIPLYHGWLIDPQNVEVTKVVGNLSYNQIVEKIISNKSSKDPVTAEEGLIAEQFLESTASQITCHGIVCLREEIKPENLAVLFRNNHFSTIYRHKDELFTLVTDLGFLCERNVVWETLSSVQGDSYFVDGNCLNCPPKSDTSQMPDNPNLDYDYQVALSLQQEQLTEPSQNCVTATNSTSDSDYELAMQLQREEERAAQQEAAFSEEQRRNISKPRAQSSVYPRSEPAHSMPRRPESAVASSRPSESKSNCIIL